MLQMAYGFFFLENKWLKKDRQVITDLLRSGHTSMFTTDEAVKKLK